SHISNFAPFKKDRFSFEILHHDTDFVIDDAVCDRLDFKLDILPAEIEYFTFQLNVLIDLHEFQVCHVHGIDMVVHNVIVVQQCHDHPFDQTHEARLCQSTEFIRHEGQHFHMDGIFLDGDFTVDDLFSRHARLQLMRRDILEDVSPVDYACKAL